MSTTTRNIWDALGDVNSTVEEKITETDVIIKSANSVVGDDTCTVDEVQREDSYKQILKIPTRDPASWSRGQKGEVLVVASETRPLTSSFPMPSLSALKKKLHLSGGIVKSHDRSQQHSSQTPPETRIASLQNDDILAKFRGILKGVPAGCVLQPNQQREADIARPSAVGSGQNQLSVKHADETAKAECMPCSRDSDVTTGDKSVDQAGSDGLSCRLVVPATVRVLDDTSNTIPAATVSAADLKKDTSIRVANRHDLGITGIDSEHKSVRKPRKRSPARVRFGIDGDATSSLLKRSHCPIVAVTPCRPVDKSPEKMHPEIVGRLRTDLRVAKHDVPVVISRSVSRPTVVLDNDEKPLDLSTVVPLSPTTLPLDLSTSGADRRAVVSVRTAATVTLKIIQPNPPVFGTRALPQKVSPVKPVQRQPLSRAACSGRLDSTAKGPFRDGAVLRNALSRRVRTAVDKLQFSNGCDQRDPPIQLSPDSGDINAKSSCDRSAGTADDKATATTQCGDFADTTETQRISRIASMLARRLGCSVSRAATSRSSWGNGPSPNTSPLGNADSAFRLTAPRRKVRKLKPPLAQVKPITICPRSRTPNTTLNETASVDWSGTQLRPSRNIGLAIVEPSKHSLHTECNEQTSQRQASLNGKSGTPISSKTQHVSASSLAVVQDASHTAPALNQDTLAIVNMNPELTSSQLSSGGDVVACKSVYKPCNLTQTLPALSRPSAVEKSQKLPSLSPPQLHMVRTPSVARNDVGEMSATSQMPELSPHADELSADVSDSCSHDSASVCKAVTPPPLLLHEDGDGYSPAVKRRRTVRQAALKLSMSDAKSSLTSGVCDAGASNPNFDLSVFMPTKPFSKDVFSRCTDTWAEDIACPSRAVGSVRHRSTFDIGRTNYYKNTILCQQMPATSRPGGRNPVTPPSRGARMVDTNKTCRQYHRDCRLPASIIAALPTLPAGDDLIRSPKLARTVAGVKRAIMANREAANAGSTPPKIACADAKKLPLSSDKHVKPNVSPKMARTVASVKQALRAGLHSSKPPSGLARKEPVRTSQLNIGIPAHVADADRLSVTDYGQSDPEISFLSPRYGYARKAFATHTETSIDAAHIGAASNCGSKHVATPCRNEPVVNKLTSSKESVKGSPRRHSCEKPKNGTPTKPGTTKWAPSAKFLAHAEFPQLDAFAVEKATTALVPIVKREPGQRDPSDAKECSSSLSDRRQQLYSSDKPLSDVETTTRDDPCHSGSASSNDADERTPAVAKTASKIKLRHSYPIVKLERVEAGPDQEMTWKCVSKPSSVSSVERRASARGQSRCRSETNMVTNPVSSQASNFSGDVSVRGRQRMSPMVRPKLRSSPPSSSCGNQHRKRRSLLDQLSNTHGYIADESRGRSNDDLFGDPSTLSREERALQRAMIKFTEMEVHAEDNAKSANATQTKLQGDEKRRSSDRRNIENAIGSCSWRGYHKDRAYEMELYRERQRRQLIRDQRQARLFSNQSVHDKSPSSSTAGRHDSASAKRKRNAFTWSSPYWKGSRSQSLKKKLYGRRVKIVKAPNTTRVRELAAPVVSRDLHELTGGKSTAKPVSFNRDGDRSVPIPADVKKLVVNREAGETVLHRAARLGYNEVALWCCQSGHVDVNAQDNAGFTPLHETCIGGHVAIAKTLLAYGADINVASRLDGIRPIHDAVEHDQIEMVRILLSCGADTNLTYSSRSLFTIAHSNEMRQFLHGYFADLNGPKKHQLASTSSWEFDPYNCTKQEAGDEQGGEEEETGCDVFDHIPSDEAASASDLQLELSDRPHLSTYNLTFSRSKGPRNYVLLRDVLDHLTVDRACLLKSLGRGFQTNTLSMAEFLYRTQHCQNLGFRYNDDANSHVELLELLEPLRSRLGVECVTFRNGDLLLDGDDEKHTGVVQPNARCSSRSLQSPLQAESLVGAPLSPARACSEHVAAITPEETACDDVPPLADSISDECDFREFDEMALMQQGYSGNSGANSTRCEGAKRHPATTSVDDRLSDLFCPATRIRIGGGEMRVLRDTNGRRLTPHVARSGTVPDLIATDAARSFDLNGWGRRNAADCVGPTAVSPNKVTRVICANTGRRLDVGSHDFNTHRNSALLADRYPHYKGQSLSRAGVSLVCSETDSASEDGGECTIKIANVCTLRGSKAIKLFAPDSPSYAASLSP